MIKPQAGKVYIIGPHCDGLYSTEIVQQVFEDGSFTCHFRGNGHLHKYGIPGNKCWENPAIVAEVGYNAEKDWWTAKELGLQ